MEIKKLSILTMGLMLILGMQSFAFPFKTSASKKSQVKFKVRIENISDSSFLTNPSGSKYPFALSPGMYVVNKENTRLFKVGKKANKGLEAQAEDGNPMILTDMLPGKVHSGVFGIFNTPVGAEQAAPILPGGSYEFGFSAEKGMKLSLITMYGQSNDLFYAPLEAIELFENGQPVSGDITDKLMLWDAGTEVNQEPGTGDEQAPRQKAADTGASENGVVHPTKDRFTYPATKNVVRVTITPEN